MNIRIATRKDKKKILKLFDDFNLFLKANDVPSEIGGSIFDEIIIKEDVKIFVAEEDNELLGMVTLFLLPNIRHGWHSGHIEDFFVTKDVRGKGVGTSILKAVIDYCQKNNIKVIKLHSGNELVNAHKFYERMGGKTTERFFRFDI